MRLSANDDLAVSAICINFSHGSSHSMQLAIRQNFRADTIPYDVFEHHAGIRDTAAAAVEILLLRLLLFYLPRTAHYATRYTLSYIRDRGLTRIYTRSEKYQKDPSGDRMKIVVPAVRRNYTAATGPTSPKRNRTCMKPLMNTPRPVQV